MFGRVRNLLRYAKLYGLYRDGVEQRDKLAQPAFWRDVLHTAVTLTEVQEMQIMLKGYKSYIVAILMGAIQVGVMLGYITQEMANELYKLLGAGAVMTVAAKINRLQKDISPPQ